MFSNTALYVTNKNAASAIKATIHRISTIPAPIGERAKTRGRITLNIKCQFNPAP